MANSKLENEPKDEKTIDGEEDEEELEMLLSNEYETVGIINSIYNRGIKKTFEDFYNNKPIEYISIENNKNVIHDQIIKSIEELNEDKDEILETARKFLKICLEECPLRDTDITDFINLKKYIDYILKSEEMRGKNQVDLLNILEEQLSRIIGYSLECYNYIDDSLREVNVIDEIYEKLLNVFNKLKDYYNKGVFPIDLDRFFIDEMVE